MDVCIRLFIINGTLLVTVGFNDVECAWIHVKQESYNFQSKNAKAVMCVEK